MRLIGDLKEKVFNAETDEEKKNIIARAGMEITNDELDSITGGYSTSKRKTSVCMKCGKPFSTNEIIGTVVKCPLCNELTEVNSAI